jgi:hypothetical protein
VRNLNLKEYIIKETIWHSDPHHFGHIHDCQKELKMMHVSSVCLSILSMLDFLNTVLALRSSSVSGFFFWGKKRPKGYTKKKKREYFAINFLLQIKIHPKCLYFWGGECHHSSVRVILGNPFTAHPNPKP